MINWTEIDRLAQAHRLIDPVSSEEALKRRLELWWCLTYNRPFKDPLLSTYNLDELAYEYLCHYYLKPEFDPLTKKEEEKAQRDDDDWIKEQLNQLKQQPSPPEKPPNPIEAPAEIPPEILNLPEISTQFDAE